MGLDLLKKDYLMEYTLSSRDGRIRFIEDVFVPKLDAPRWGEIYPVDDSEKEKSGRIIAEELHDLGEPLLLTGFLVALLLLATDLLIFLDAQLYGMYVNIWASLAFLFPSLKGRNIIATVVDGESKAAYRRLEVQSLVANAAGFCLFGLGFILQILSEQFLMRPELVGENLAVNYLPGWFTALALLFVFWSTGKFMSWRRSTLLSQKDYEVADE